MPAEAIQCVQYILVKYGQRILSFCSFEDSLHDNFFYLTNGDGRMYEKLFFLPHLQHMYGR